MAEEIIAEPEQEKTVAIRQSVYDKIAANWDSFVDYAERQSDIDAMIEKNDKQRKTAFGFLELFVLIGFISLSVLSVLSLIIVLWFAFTGISVGALPLLLAGAVFLLFGVNIFQFIRVFQAGEWFKFGLNLRKYKHGFIGFTKGRGILLVATPYKQKQFFRKGNKKTGFMMKEKGFHDTSTGATVNTVREGELADFDVEKEYSSDLDQLSPQLNDAQEESFFSGMIWNKIDLPMLKSLLIVCILVSGMAAIMSMGGIALAYSSNETMTKQLSGMDGNISAKITEIKNLLPKNVPAVGISSD